MTWSSPSSVWRISSGRVRFCEECIGAETDAAGSGRPGALSPLTTTIGSLQIRVLSRTDRVHQFESIHIGRWRSVTTAAIVGSCFAAASKLHVRLREQDCEPGSTSPSAISRGATLSASSTIRTVLDHFVEPRAESDSPLRDRKKVARNPRIRFKLLPQTDDVRVHRAGVRVGFVTPHRIQNDISRQRSVGVMQKVHQQIVFGWRELHFCAAGRGDAAVEIHFDFAETEDPCVRGPPAAVTLGCAPAIRACQTA